LSETSHPLSDYSRTTKMHHKKEHVILVVVL